jgi:hypothetical protein
MRVLEGCPSLPAIFISFQPPSGIYQPTLSTCEGFHYQHSGEEKG